MKNLNKIILVLSIVSFSAIGLNGMEKKKRIEYSQLTKENLKDIEKVLESLSLNKKQKQEILNEIQKPLDPDKYKSSQDFNF
jgi:hypothetical protein